MHDSMFRPNHALPLPRAAWEGAGGGGEQLQSLSQFCLDKVISDNLGFGGHNAALVFKAYEGEGVKK